MKLIKVNQLGLQLVEVYLELSLLVMQAKDSLLPLALLILVMLLEDHRTI
jgi:hypothetical protein